MSGRSSPTRSTENGHRSPTPGETPFAGQGNVTFESGSAWTSEISHRELVRSGYDQNFTGSLDALCFVYQGASIQLKRGSSIFGRPYRLGLLGLAE